VRREHPGTTTRASQDRLAALIDAMRTRSRPVKIVKKSGVWHQRAAAKLLWALTFGGQRTYLSHYVTTLGHTIYVPDDWDAWDPDHAWQTLRHELVHVAQFERLGWLGMIVIYGFLPLPVGLAYGRARIEWEAYQETLRATAELCGLKAARDPRLADQIVARFTGPDYGWMWPFRSVVEGWYDRVVNQLLQEPGTVRGA